MNESKVSAPTAPVRAHLVAAHPIEWFELAEEKIGKSDTTCCLFRGLKSVKSARVRLARRFPTRRGLRP